MQLRFIRQHVNTSVAALMLAEGTLYFLVLCASAMLRFGADVSPEQLRWPLAQLAFVFSGVMLTTSYALGLYNSRQRARMSGILLRGLIAIVTGIVLLMLMSYLMPKLSIGRGIMGMATAFSLAAFFISRIIFVRVVPESFFKRRVLVYGAGRNAVVIAGLRRRSDRLGFELVGYVQAQDEPLSVPASLVVNTGRSLADFCVINQIDEVIVAMDDRRRSFPMPELLDCRFAGIEVSELITFLERETGRVRLDVLNPSWMIFGGGFERGSLRTFSSRLLDLAASSLILLLALPVMLLTVLAIKLEDGWRAPVFYGQRRIGVGGRVFEVLKFRSMRTDAERDGKAIWAIKGDTRVTRVGAFIRKTRIDELPQILCVFRGDMGFVGPRPERPEFVADLAQKIPYYGQRHCVKPGITGWAQLCYPYGASERDAVEKLQYDLYYIKNNTLLFDLSILLQTVEVVLTGHGAR